MLSLDGTQARKLQRLVASTTANTPEENAQIGKYDPENGDTRAANCEIDYVIGYCAWPASYAHALAMLAKVSCDV